MAKGIRLNNAEIQFGTVDESGNFTSQVKVREDNNNIYIGSSNDHILLTGPSSCRPDFGLNNRVSDLKININGYVYSTYKRNGTSGDTSKPCAYCNSCAGNCNSCQTNTACGGCTDCTKCAGGCTSSCHGSCDGCYGGCRTNCYDSCRGSYCSGCAGGCFNTCRSHNGSFCSGCYQSCQPKYEKPTVD